MENSQLISFAKKIIEILDSNPRSILSKLEESDNYKIFKCKIKGNASVSFDLSIVDISGTMEYHIFKSKDPSLVSQTYKLTVKNAGTEKSISVTNQDKLEDAQNDDIFNLLEQLCNAIKQASEKNLNSDMEDIIKN